MDLINILRGLKNADTLKSMQSGAIFYDMSHIFIQNKVRHAYISSITFHKEIKNQPFIDFAFSSHNYRDMLPQNQVILHGIMYKSLYNMYVKYLKKHLNNTPSETSLINDSISSEEYQKLPKIYRGIFTKYDNNHYIVNEPYHNMVFAYNKKNKKKLEELLKRASELIPLIYDERKNVPDIDFGGAMKVYESPTFVSDSFAAKQVSKEQMDTILELREIFIELAKITTPCKVEPKKLSTAREMFMEYNSVKKRKNFIADQNSAEKAAATHRDIQIQQEHNRIKQHKKNIETIKEQYNDTRNEILGFVKQQIKVRIN